MKCKAIKSVLPICLQAMPLSQLEYVWNKAIKCNLYSADKSCGNIICGFKLCLLSSQKVDFSK